MTLTGKSGGHRAGIGTAGVCEGGRRGGTVSQNDAPMEGGVHAKVPQV